MTNALTHLSSQQLSFFEGAVSNTIDQTKHIPEEISATGKIGVSAPSPLAVFTVPN